MKRCFIWLYLISCLYINLCAQSSDMMGLSLWEKYGSVDVNYLPEYNIFSQPTQSRSNCQINNTTRGKEYASLFIPAISDSILNIRINLIFIQKDDGSGNFQENNTEHQALFDDIMTALNNKTFHLTYPGADCFIGAESDIIQDIRIRFCDHRYYIKKSSVWNNNLFNSSRNLNPDPYIGQWYLLGIDDSLNAVLNDTLKGINIYYTEDSTLYNRFWEISNLTDTMAYGNSNTNGACSMWPNYQNLHASSRIHMPCLYSKLWWMKNIVPQLNEFNQPSWDNEVRSWLVDGHASTLLHEIGHSFYLLHPQDDYYRPYHSYPLRDCWYTIMQPSGSSPHNFLPPIEMGLMYISTMTTNLQQFIPSNTYLGTKTLNTTVSLPRMRMFYSLLIGSSGNVTMPCDMTFSTLGYIKVQSGGVLAVDGASLQSIQDSWGGIVVQSGGQLLLSDVSVGDYNIIVKSGGCLIVTDGLTITGDHSITIEDGGYLCVDADASIDLVDNFSLIVVSPNAILGCPSCSNNCLLSRTNMSNSGNGRFVLYSGTSYIQNTIITSDSIATGSVVYAGYDVTNDIQYGNVVVEDGGELRIKANETTLTNGVEVKLGGTLTIEK